MKILDPGHKYELGSIDGEYPQTIQFVKRDSPAEAYPGNTGHYSGTTIQEVMRALIDRAKYVNNQIPCAETQLAIEEMRQVIWLMEKRAAVRHGRVLKHLPFEIELVPGCKGCGHIECSGDCGRK